MPQSELRIIISGGGTGGHIFPAIAIADAIRRRNPEAAILFVGALGRMEMEKVPAAGYKIEGLNITGFKRSLSLSNLALPFKLLQSSLKARSIIRNFRPGVVVGVGGFASGPTLRAASALGITTILQEQNSFPGVTNKLLSRNAVKICVAYDGMERFFRSEKIVVTGNPVRSEIENKTIARAEALAAFRLNPDLPVVLVVGGSLGARTINRSIQQGIEQLVKNQIQLIWQTGKSYAESIEFGNFDKNQLVCQQSFISHMDYAYAAADIVVSRAGAIAISELCITGKPCILVPSPNVAEDHQTKNALALVSRNAAMMVTDAEAPDSLINNVVNLIQDKTRMKQLSDNILAMAKPGAADTIAGIVLDHISHK